MAPALPVYNREEIERIYPNIFNREKIDKEEIPNNCKLYELNQNQCTYDGNKVYCLPFKRIFLRCLENKNNDVIGYKLMPLHKNSKSKFEINNNDNDNDNKNFRDYEITIEDDNNYKIDDKIKEFLNADFMLKKRMKEYYDNNNNNNNNLKK